jgi:hypothetical protein
LYAVYRPQPLIRVAGVLAASIRVMQKTLRGWRYCSAIFRASSTIPRSSRSLSDQPTTRCEKRSMVTTRYNQPSRVHRLAQPQLAVGIVDCRSSRFCLIAKRVWNQ